MVRTKKISAKELPELIRVSYEGDKDILETQHVMPFDNLDDAVEATTGMIEQMAAEKNLNYYKVIWQKRDIGYYITFDNFLFSFGINKEYRKKDILVGWWDWVKGSLKKNFMCLLYPHQASAIGFLKKNGMLVAEVDKENNCIILIHKN